MNLHEIQTLVHQEYIKNGYEERWSVEYLKDHPEELDLVIDIAEVGLINTEVSELLEDIRKGKIENYGEECADIIIRVLNWANRKGFKVEPYIHSKHMVNMDREKLHGKLV